MQLKEAPTANGPAQVTPVDGPPSAEKSQLKPVSAGPDAVASVTSTLTSGSVPVFFTSW